MKVIDHPVFWFSAGAVFVGLWWSLFPPLRNDISKKDARPRKKVVCFGDSITQFGFNVADRGWVSQLADWWSRKVDVVNRGFSGYTSRQALDMVERFVISEVPDLVTVFFGANDAALPGFSQHVPLEEYKSNIANIVRALRERIPSVRLLLITPPPVYEPVWQEQCKIKGRELDRNNDITKEYAHACEEIAKQLNVAHVNSFKLLHGDTEGRQNYLNDGLHLNDQGNELIFQAVRNAIVQQYSEFNSDNMVMDAPHWSEVFK